MLKTFVLFLGCFLEEQWWISGIRYGSCSNWFFVFWLILFLTDFLLHTQEIIRVSRKSLFTSSMLHSRLDLISGNSAKTHHAVTEVRANLFLADFWPACVVCNKDLSECYNHCSFDNPHLSPSLQAWGSGTWILNIEIQIRNRCHGNTAPLVSCHKRVSMFP